MGLDHRAVRPLPLLLVLLLALTSPRGAGAQDPAANCVCTEESFPLANCTGASTSVLLWHYPVGACVSDGSASRRVLACDRVDDYADVNCTGVPIRSFAGAVSCAGSTSILSIRLNCTSRAAPSLAGAGPLGALAVALLLLLLLSPP